MARLVIGSRASHNGKVGGETQMNIGQASQQAGIPAKMIRYYESIGLLPQADRRASGYRDYSDEDVSRLKFLRRARSLGFSVSQVEQLMRLWSDRDRSNADVRELALSHAAELEVKARQLQEMIDTLRRLARACQRGDRPECPIIEELGGGQLAGSGRGNPFPPTAEWRRSRYTQVTSSKRRSPLFATRTTRSVRWRPCGTSDVGFSLPTLPSR